MKNLDPPEICALEEVMGVAVQAFTNPITPSVGMPCSWEHNPAVMEERKKDLNVLSLMAVQYEKQI